MARTAVLNDRFQESQKHKRNSNVLRGRAAHTAKMQARTALVSRSYLEETLVDTGAFLGEQYAQLQKRQDEQEQRITALEARPVGLTYEGVWKDGQPYLKHQVCTHDGSMWVCRTDTLSKPGVDRTWVLSVKKGRDGRGLKAT